MFWKITVHTDLWCHLCVDERHKHAGKCFAKYQCLGGLVDRYFRSYIFWKFTISKTTCNYNKPHYLKLLTLFWLQKAQHSIFFCTLVKNIFHTMRRFTARQHHFAYLCWNQSLTFAHSISISLQLTVFHTRNDVKQSKDLFLGQCSPCWHHQTACKFTRAEVHHLIVAGVSCRRNQDTRGYNRTETTAGIHLQRFSRTHSQRDLSIHSLLLWTKL